MFTGSHRWPRHGSIKHSPITIKKAKGDRTAFRANNDAMISALASSQVKRAQPKVTFLCYIRNQPDVVSIKFSMGLFRYPHRIAVEGRVHAGGPFAASRAQLL